MRISRILVANKERKKIYVNDYSDLIDSALRSGLDYELHHGRIDSHPSGGCTYSRARPHNPRKASAVEQALNETWGAKLSDKTFTQPRLRGCAKVNSKREHSLLYPWINYSRSIRQRERMQLATFTSITYDF
jgi:hypothetical protein